MWKWFISFGLLRWVSAILFGIAGVVYVWYYLGVQRFIAFDIFILICIGVLYSPTPKPHLKGESILTTFIMVIAVTSLDDLYDIPKEIRHTIVILIISYGVAVMGLTSHHIENPRRIDEPNFWDKKNPKLDDYLQRPQQTIKDWWKFRK